MKPIDRFSTPFLSLAALLGGILAGCLILAALN